MQRRIELGPHLHEMTDFTEFVNEIRKPPQLLDFYFRWCQEMPADWPATNPPWPQGGLLFCMTEFWSSMRSDRNPRNKHHVLTAWSNTPNPHLQIKGPLSKLFSWKCTCKGGLQDVCSIASVLGKNLNTYFFSHSGMR